MPNKINWRRILDAENILWIDKGSNVKKGNIGICCPFCGSADSGFHMGIDADGTGWWGCWRNETHRGKSPLRLLMKLLHISYNAARKMAGLSDDYVDPDGFSELAARLSSKQVLTKETKNRFQKLKLDKEFLCIQPIGGTSRAWDYLISRGFLDSDIPRLCCLYELKTAISGWFQDRIILPYVVDGELVAWSARAITNAIIRYKDLPLEECLTPPKQTLFNHDAATCGGGQILIVVEGPFDALKLDFYGRDFGVRAVALSTNSITENQTYLLEEYSSQFQKITIMMDTATELGVVDSMRMKGKVSGIKNVGFSAVPFGYKDAGELPPHRVIQYSRSIT